MGDMQPTDRELEALKVLWERREATVRDVCDALNARGAGLAYTTVLSLLQVMEQKGLVRSWVGESTEVRDGRRRKHFELRPLGARALKEMHRTFAAMTAGVERRLKAL